MVPAERPLMRSRVDAARPKSLDRAKVVNRANRSPQVRTGRGSRVPSVLRADGARQRWDTFRTSMCG